MLLIVQLLIINGCVIRYLLSFVPAVPLMTSYWVRRYHGKPRYNYNFAELEKGLTEPQIQCITKQLFEVLALIFVISMIAMYRPWHFFMINASFIAI